MSLKQLYNSFFKIIGSKSAQKIKNNASVFKQFYSYLIYFFYLVIVFIIYTVISNQINNASANKQKNFENLIETNDVKKIGNYFLKKLRSPYNEIEYTIQINDSINSILTKLNIRNTEIKIIIAELKERKLHNIYVGRKISLVVKKIDKEKNSIINMLYPISNTLSVEIRKNKNSFQIKKNILQLYKKEVVVRNIINNNLYSSAVEVDIEPNIIVEFARIYGFEIDFQRDIRKGDWFEIYYEKFVDDNNVVRDTGKIIYASMFVNNNEINLYNFKDKNEYGYYDISGKSIVKSLMKTPINGARLSSSFGMRKHPILGFTKKHNGTDFAAAMGTPIMASGSGTITRSRWCGGGGNCVKIKHNSTYETIYAHMKSFAKGIKEGRKVRQGQIIGYVGSTGMSTGPHLHYEVIVNGKKVNSQKLKLPSGKILTQNARKNFEIERIKIDLKLSEIRN